MTIFDLATDGLLHPPADETLQQRAIAAATALLAVRPLFEIRLDDVAAEVGVPLPVLREQVPDLSTLLVVSIESWYASRMRRVEGGAALYGTVVFLRELLAVSIEDPLCARTVFTAASLAGTPDHAAAAQLRQMWVRFHAVVQRALTHDVAAGREPDSMDPANGAEQLLAIYEGLQFQWLFRPHMDLLAAYDRAATRLRAGWAEIYTAPSWDI